MLIGLFAATCGRDAGVQFLICSNVPERGPKGVSGEQVRNEAKIKKLSGYI